MFLKDNASVVALVTPAAAGSKGDEGMILATLHCLNKLGVKRIKLLSLERPIHEFTPIDLYTEPYDLSESARFGGEALRREFVSLVDDCDTVFFVGADVLDGYYSLKKSLMRIDLARECAKATKNTTILGFSLTKYSNPLCVEALSNLPSNVRLCLRDPLSFSRARHLLRREVTLVADTAFLLQPDTECNAVKSVKAWIDSERSDGRIVLGLNLSVHSISKRPEGTEYFIDYYRDIIHCLSDNSNRFSFLFIPHDTRPGQEDEALLLKIMERLPWPAGEHAMMVNSQMTAAQIKEICGSLDLIYTSRMHLAISGLSQGIPSLNIIYQGKEIGLFKHFSWLQGLVRQQEFSQKDLIISRLKHVAKDKDALKIRLKAKIAPVLELAWKNFL